MHTTPLQSHRNRGILTDITDKSSDKIYEKVNSVKSIVKRSADWSKRIAASSQLQDDSPSSHVAEESEHVEITSKAPRIVRRMRFHHGSPQINENQDVEEYREIIPNTRVANGAGKIVRVKKFRRKPIRKTTSEPETTTTISTTTAKMPYTEIPKVTQHAEYTHITVINKEVRNPKRNKKHKRKRPRNQLVPTAPYDSDVKQNGYMRVTVMPEQNSYPDYGGYYTGRRSTVSRPRQRDSSSETELMKIQNNNPSVQGKRIVYEPLRAGSSEANVLTERNSGETIGQPNKMKNRRLPLTPRIKDSVPDIQETKFSVENVTTTTEIPTKEDTVQTRKDSSNNDSKISNQDSVVLHIGEEATNKTNPVNVNLESTPVPNPSENTHARNAWPGQQTYPSRFPGFLYDEQDGFADPFFHSHGIPTNLDRSQQNEPLMPNSWVQPFSSYYSPNDPHRGDYMFGQSSQPDQRDQLIAPGFHFSPQLTSLRRSILDTYDEGTTTSEPVTHFTLPKFDIPSIDFNDKGCQTVYKEVKTLPGADSRASNGNAKSFIMSRECFFPNGVPTTEDIRQYDATESPVVEKS